VILFVEERDLVVMRKCRDIVLRLRDFVVVITEPREFALRDLIIEESLGANVPPSSRYISRLAR